MGGVTPAYDARGNMTYEGVRTFGYSSENLLASATGGVTLAYDPLTRLYQTGGAVTARFAYDASALFAEYDGGNALQRRYVHGPGTDEPLVWYEGAGTSGRRFLHADERGSIIAVSDSAGTVIGLNKYDEYGKPAPANIGRFQYTGQTWLPELQLYYYKNRMYHPNLGRFMQPDPIGYEGGLNLYNYVGSDPVNFTDPDGLAPKKPNIVCTGTRIASGCGGGGIAGGLSGSSSAGVGGQAPSPGEGVGSGGGWVKVSTPVYSEGDNIVVTAAKYVWRSLTHAAFLGGGGDFGGGGASGEFPCGCFKAGTLVSTPRGLRRIEEIEIGDFVLAQNERTGELAPKPVTDLVRPKIKRLYELRVWDADGKVETFHATDDHPWSVEGKGWVETANLMSGDRINTASDDNLFVASLAATDRVEQTYNLTVADWHTFLVGEDRAVVHNVECIDEYGRALAKKFGRPDSAFPDTKGSAAALNRQGRAIAQGILMDPERTTIHHYQGRYGNVTDIFASDGRGLRYGPSGKFIGFLEPRR